MALYDISNTNFQGIQHGNHEMYGYIFGKIELSDEEVISIVNLIKEKGTTNIKEMDLENINPDIFRKLHQAYHKMAYDSEEYEWLWNGYYEGAYEYDPFELMEYCENECGFTFEAEEDDYLDEDGEFDEDTYEEDKMDAFFSEWLEPYIESLDHSDQKEFFYTKMNAEVSIDEDDLRYEVLIPETIIKMAKIN